MRLFIAIQFSDDMKKSLIGLMHDLKARGVKGSYVPAANLHMTLCFIGETKERETIQEALKNVKYKPFKLSLSDLGTFGDLLWVGSRGGQGINNLASDIRKALDEAGIPYDRQKFVPHITLVRKMTGNPGKLSVPKGEMMVKRVSLMKSEQVGGKVVYTEIFSF